MYISVYVTNVNNDWVNPNVAYLCREKTRKRVSDVAAHRLGQVEAYFEYVKSCPRRAQPQMASYRASVAVFAGVGMQH
jgi:hypothetical protein